MWRWWRKRATQERGANVERRLDADLETVKRERLPEKERRAVGWRLLRDEDFRYFDCFEAGYAWGEQAEIFLLGPAGILDKAEQAADEYGALVDLLSTTRLGSAPLRVAEVLTPALLGSMDGQVTTNADTNPYVSAEEAFRARLSELVLADANANDATVEQADDSRMESVFYAGAMFYAFETQLLLALRRRARMTR